GAKIGTWGSLSSLRLRTQRNGDQRPIAETKSRQASSISGPSGSNGSSSTSSIRLLRLFPDDSDRLKQRLRRIGLPKKSDWVQCRSAFKRPLIDIGGSKQDWNGLLRLQPSRHFDTVAVVGELDIHHHQFRRLAFGLGHRRRPICSNTQ